VEAAGLAELAGGGVIRGGEAAGLTLRVAEVLGHQAEEQVPAAAGNLLARPAQAQAAHGDRPIGLERSTGRHEADYEPEGKPAG
jgi:hypothetical protein